jgi:hypothetical protein
MEISPNTIQQSIVISGLSNNLNKDNTSNACNLPQEVEDKMVKAVENYFQKLIKQESAKSQTQNDLPFINQCEIMISNVSKHLEILKKIPNPVLLPTKWVSFFGNLTPYYEFFSTSKEGVTQKLRELREVVYKIRFIDGKITQQAGNDLQNVNNSSYFELLQKLKECNENLINLHGKYTYLLSNVELINASYIQESNEQV